MAKPDPLITLTISAAARNFGPDRHTLAGLLTKAGIKPDDAGEYTIAQICAAIYSDLTAEKIGLTRAQRIKEETLQRLRDGELIAVADAITIAQRFTFAARQKILLATMPDEEKQAILQDLYGMASADYTKGATADETE